MPGVDAQSFSSGRRDARWQSGRGYEMAAGTYTGQFNRRHKLLGHLFSGRYKAVIVEDSGGGYLKTVCDYVHLNPARAKLPGWEHGLGAFPWSSLRIYLRSPRNQPIWLRVGAFAGGTRYSARPPDGPVRVWPADGTASPDGSGAGRIRGGAAGMVPGEPGISEELPAQMKEQMGEHHYGEERVETERERAEARVGASGFATVGVDPGRLGDTSQRPSRESEAGVAVAR